MNEWMEVLQRVTIKLGTNNKVGFDPDALHNQK